MPASNLLNAARPHAAAPDPRRANPNLARLIAAVVPGRVDFTTEADPTPSRAEALPLYRRPADKHAAATAVNAGRLIDVCG